MDDSFRRFVERALINRTIGLPIAIHNVWYQGTPEALAQALRDLPQRYPQFRARDNPIDWELVELNGNTAEFRQLDPTTSELPEHHITFTLYRKGELVGFNMVEKDLGDFDLLMALNTILTNDHGFCRVQAPPAAKPKES